MKIEFWLAHSKKGGVFFCVYMNSLISIIIPVYNESKNVPLIYKEISFIFKKILNYSYEMMFVDDGSNDGTRKILGDLSVKDPDVKFICFSRNFGKEIAVSAGLHNASGAAAIVIDADLQHPPALIPEFISRWEDGADVVIGLRKKNECEGLVKKYGSILFYKIMNQISETSIVPHTTDFRLIDRKVIDIFYKLTERNRITRGLIDWLGFKRDFVYFEAPARINGKASYSNKKLLRLAFNSFISHSLFPLRLAGYLGGFITIISALVGLFVVIEKYIFNDPWQFYFSGTAILALLILFLVGIILSCFGLVALYIASIHSEVLNRPLYVIKEKNF